MTWAESELAQADLGDKRRNKRLIKIVEDLVEQHRRKKSRNFEKC